MEGKKGEMGVGVLIVFIAMLLVAAIAAGVLITTVTTLQQKALTTGSETKGEISTHMTFVEVTAQNGTDGAVDNFTALIKLSAGSDPISFEELLVALSLSNASNNYRYSTTTTDTDEFQVTYEVQGTEYQSGFLSRGDIVSLTLVPDRLVWEDETVRITMIPKIGTQSMVEFRTPAVISSVLMTAFP